MSWVLGFTGWYEGTQYFFLSQADFDMNYIYSMQQF
jgi:hypothetical protein